jgi:O-antigen ligase
VTGWPLPPKPADQLLAPLCWSPAALVAGLGLSVACGAATPALVDAFGPLAPLALLPGAVFVWFALGSLEVTMAVLLAAVVIFEREILFQLSIPFFGGGLKPIDVMLLLAFGGFFVRRVLGGPVAGPLPAAMTWMLSVFIGWAVLTAAHGIARGVPYKDTLVELRPMLQYLLFIPIVIEFGYRNVRRILTVVMACSFGMGLRAVYMFAHGEGISASYTGGLVRVMDFEYAYLLFSILIAAALYVEGHWSRGLLLAVLGACFAGLVCTFYRAGFLGLGVGLLFLLAAFSWRGRRRLVQTVVVGSLSAAVLATAVMVVKPSLAEPLLALGSRMGSLGTFEEDASAVHRLREWRAASALIAEHPLVGNGLGSRIQFFSPMYDVVNRREGYWSNDYYIHNSYIWLAVKMGGIGLVLFLALTAALFRECLGGLRRWPVGEPRTVLAGLTACLVALMVISLFGPMFNGTSMTPFMGFLTGAIFVLTREMERRT